MDISEEYARLDVRPASLPLAVVRLYSWKRLVGERVQFGLHTHTCWSRAAAALGQERRSSVRTYQTTQWIRVFIQRVHGSIHATRLGNWLAEAGN